MGTPAGDLRFFRGSGGGEAGPLGSPVSPTARPKQSTPMTPGPPGCSVGIMAYNEAANIANAIRTLLQQVVSCARIEELVVVASGCTDATAEIVAALAEEDPRVRLLVQDQRQGKASAINLFIAGARSPLLLMVSADVLVEEGTVEALLRHFADPEVGMVGGHPIPVNDEGTFLGYAVHLLWRLHDRLARAAPKLGEIVAFRNVVPGIPVDTAVDEISIQALMTQLGYRMAYEPDAVVYNRGPATISDFLVQRRRIYAGHLQVRRRQGYAASTMSTRRIAGALRGSGSFSSPRLALWTSAAIGLEALARALGYLDAAGRRQHSVWRPAVSTKARIAEGAIGQGPTSVLVFHIVNFHRQQLEVGVRASRLLTQRVLQCVRQTLGAEATVSAEKSGTVIALLFAEREEAERVAGQIVEQLGGAGGGRTDLWEAVRVKLACGIIAFPQVGQAVATSMAPIQSVPGGAMAGRWAGEVPLLESSVATSAPATPKESPPSWA